MIKLKIFEENDSPTLISEIPDARFLLQWAGPNYIYPLDTVQLIDTSGNPSFKVFRAIRTDNFETIGHIQLMDIEPSTSSCVLGRVLIFEKYRGNGFGKEITQAAVNYAFENLNLSEVTLSVFDFNTPAIKAYKSLGFSEFQIIKGARKFQNESWNIIKMKMLNG